MALIKCPECGQEISDKAPACPKCGNPLQDINKITQQSPVTIEQTKKTWKIIRLISWIMIIIGVILFFKGLGNGGFNNPSTGAGIFIGLLGIVGNLIGKFGGWWTNR